MQCDRRHNAFPFKIRVPVITDERGSRPLERWGERSFHIFSGDFDQQYHRLIYGFLISLIRICARCLRTCYDAVHFFTYFDFINLIEIGGQHEGPSSEMGK